jgi:hypothetical protein
MKSRMTYPILDNYAKIVNYWIDPNNHGQMIHSVFLIINVRQSKI